MKKLIKLLLIGLTLNANAATDPIKIPLSFKQLNGTDELPQGKPINKTDLDKIKAEVIVEISGVMKESDMDGFSYATYAKDTVHYTAKRLNAVYNKGNQTYTITITSVINLLEQGQHRTFGIKNAAGKTRWAVDILWKEKELDPALTPTDCSQKDFQSSAQKEFDLRILPNAKTQYNIIDKNGIFIGKDNIVHIFIDHYGKYYGHATPTVATEKFLYQVHVITADCLKSAYSFDYTGAYSPQFNIDSNKGKGVNPQSGGVNNIAPYVIDYAVIGPFTDQFTFNLTRIVGAGKAETIVSPTVPVAKLYYVSITAGLIGTTLRNPQNITKSPLPKKGDTTLVADDPNVRGFLSILAIYYPTGRSFLYPPNGGPFDPSRLGIVVGTELGQAINENFLLGLSHDFARGGALIYGVHFGRRNVVSGSPHFKYGRDIYTSPALDVKKQWNVGFFFGVSVDMRVALQLFKNLGSAL